MYLTRDSHINDEDELFIHAVKHFLTIMDSGDTNHLNSTFFNNSFPYQFQVTGSEPFMISPTDQVHARHEIQQSD